MSKATQFLVKEKRYTYYRPALGVFALHSLFLY
jgi:hypothetical protein